MKKLFAVLFLLCAGQIQGADLDRVEPETVGMSSDRLARIKPFMARYWKRTTCSGFTP